jgi:subtilisin-like proprotein convertase family protein
LEAQAWLGQNHEGDWAIRLSDGVSGEQGVEDSGTLHLWSSREGECIDEAEKGVRIRFKNQVQPVGGDSSTLLAFQRGEEKPNKRF